MKQSRHSLRAARIGLLGCSDQDRATLTRQLSRLGAVSVTCHAVEEEHVDGATKLTALFVDGEAEISEHMLPAGTCRRVPTIALVGSEAPSHLNRILRLSISAYLMKPVRTAGVLTALRMGCQMFDRCSKLEDQIERLEDRLKGRRHVFAAQLAIMTEYGISETAAFARLRGAAMERRMTIEEISAELVAGNERVSVFG